jgi:hypothetical protein
MRDLGVVLWLALFSPSFTWTQATTSAGTPVQIIITVGHNYGRQAPSLARDDVVVTGQFDPLPVTNLIPLKGDRAGLELFLLVDGCSDCEPGSKFDELRRFIVAQPSTTAVGVAYIDAGRLKVVENPTADHARAVRALKVPAGSKPASPFGVLPGLIQGWRQGSSRRVILMVSNGIDPAAPESAPDPSADAAIEAAQRAGVSIYAIYHPSADYINADFSKIYSGQVQLAHVAAETGGEAYFITFGPLTSLAPFLADMREHLANQYLLDFLVSPGESSAFRDITVKCKLPDVDVMAPSKVWVPGRKTGL